MSEFVQLYLKRNRGWPWPEKSWGLTPMFGEDGWCRSCGVPQRAQNGSLMLQRRNLTVAGAWVPNWQFDTICLERSLAEKAASLFRLELLPVEWPGTAPGDAMQIVIPTVGNSWFDSDELSAAAVAEHGAAGSRCSACRIWRWLPLSLASVALQIKPGLGDADIAASPEWFGDGWKAFREVLVRRELAELLVAESPRDFKIQEVPGAP